MKWHLYLQNCIHFLYIDTILDYPLLHRKLARTRVRWKQSPLAPNPLNMTYLKINCILYNADRKIIFPRSWRRTRAYKSGRRSLNVFFFFFGLIAGSLMQDFQQWPRPTLIPIRHLGGCWVWNGQGEPQHKSRTFIWWIYWLMHFFQNIEDVPIFYMFLYLCARHPHCLCNYQVWLTRRTCHWMLMWGLVQMVPWAPRQTWPQSLCARHGHSGQCGARSHQSGQFGAGGSKQCYLYSNT